MDTVKGVSAPRGKILRFFSHPAVGIIGSAASVLGVLLAVYFFLQTTPRPMLTYSVYPVKAAIVRADQSSPLSVTLGGRKVRSDVTAVQVAFWNAGTAPIRSDAVLRPLVIKTAGGVPILEARLRKKSRDVVDVTLDTAKLSRGELAARWNILERNDGGVVQLTIAGGIDVGISAEAIIEGQSAIRPLAFPGRIQTPIEQFEETPRVFRLAAWSSLGSGLFILALMTPTLVILRRRSEDRLPLSRYLYRFCWANIISGLALAAVGMYLLLFFREIGPPFGF